MNILLGMEGNLSGLSRFGFFEGGKRTLGDRESSSACCQRHRHDYREELALGLCLIHRAHSRSLLRTRNNSLPSLRHLDVVWTWKVFVEEFLG